MDRPLISLYRTADVRKMDREAIAGGIDGYELMTRAARFSLDSLRAVFPATAKLLVLCGAGNNAGDGYVVARLAKELGWEVVVCGLASPARLGGEAAKAWLDFTGGEGHESVHLTDFDPVLLEKCDVVVDALLGTGLSREVAGEYARVIQCVNDASVDVISLDVPSGLNSDSGLPQPIAVRAALTVTFIAPKLGLFTGRASSYSGKVVCDRLGLPASLFNNYLPAARMLTEHDARDCLPRREIDAHKGDHGRVLVVGGDVGMSGAVVLTAKAALRSGAGTVTVACHTHNREIVAGYSAELMCVGVSHPDALEPMIDECDVIAVGPGMGRSAWGRSLFDCVVQSSKPVVIDADGLRLLANSGATRVGGSTILTPHPGEAAALLGLTSSDVQKDRIASALSIADKFNAVAVLKGAGTVVAFKANLPAICGLGNPGMATAGSGDILTGIVAGIWAQQLHKQSCAFEAACAAVYVHALAGDRAAKDGERGLIASDLLKHVRHCVNFSS